VAPCSSQLHDPLHREALELINGYYRISTFKQNKSVMMSGEPSTPAMSNPFPTIQTAEGESETSFHLFPKLPFELRLKVWKLNMAESQTVKIPLSGLGMLMPVRRSRSKVTQLKWSELETSL
jgi:hypothetical protein